MSIVFRCVRALLISLASLSMVLCMMVGTASAHAKVVSATPGIGSTITTAPTTISVTTAENMKPGAKNSNLFVYGPDGELISQGDAKVSLNDPKQMSVAIKPEKAPGIYVVRWITVSADDNDPDEGAFGFTVNPSGASAPTTVAPVTHPIHTTEQSESEGMPIWSVVLIGLLALLLGLGAGLGIGRRKNGSVLATPAATSPAAAEETVPKSEE